MLLPFAGFLAGLHHVVTGPDHLAAVAPLAVHDRWAAWRGGFSWAVGHAGGVALVALVALGFRELGVLNAEILSGWSERIVGVVLLGIGLWGLKKAFSRRLHAHVHDHDGQRHIHMHVHAPEDAHEPVASGRHHHTHAALGIGTLHGMAGGSHLLGVLPALALNTSDAVLYLAAYGVGTITAMVIFALLVGGFSAAAGQAGVRWTRGLMTFASVAAIVVGVYWLIASGQHAA